MAKMNIKSCIYTMREQNYGGDEVVTSLKRITRDNNNQGGIYEKTTIKRRK